MTSLGANGRFGNQLLQYGFLRLYAARHRLLAETPDWIGRYVYGCNDPDISLALPPVDENTVDLPAALRGDLLEPPRNCDLRGYFCGDTRDWGPVAAEFRGLFEPVSAIRCAFEKALERLRDRGRTLVAIHLRRGDFGYGRFWIAPADWYVQWLRRLWPELERPVLYVASDAPNAAAPFAEFSPLQNHDLDSSPDPLPLLLDHFVLTRAEYLAISNSSFSFSAALLNPGLSTSVRPHPDRRELVPFDPWASPVLIDPIPREPRPRASQGRAPRIRPGQCVVHYGGYCAEWTHAVRREFPSLMVHELDDGDSLDALRARRSEPRIHHLYLADSVPIDTLIEQAHDAFACAHVETVHFQASHVEAEHVVVRLTELGFRESIGEAGSPLRCMVHQGSSSFYVSDNAGAIGGAEQLSASKFAGKVGMGSVNCGERPAFLAASMYTPSHRALAERLAASLRALGVPFILYEVPTVHRSISARGSDDPTYTKANFVRYVLDTYGVPILYMDCDCVLRSEPLLIRCLIGAGAEFAIYNWLADVHTDAYAPVELRGADGQLVKPADRFFRFWYSIDAFSPTQLLCSGATQLYADTPAARELLGTWASVIRDHPGVVDDHCLDVAFNSRLTGLRRPRSSWLDKAYARYLFWIFARPVIDHPQFPSGRRQPTTPHVPLPEGPRFRLDIAETRSDARLLPRDCLIDTQLKRLLRSQPSPTQPGQMEAADIGPLLQELYLG
jgi:hypothetical protein